MNYPLCIIAFDRLSNDFQNSKASEQAGIGVAEG